MKEASVDIGKLYALRSQNGGEVTNENGETLATLEANTQQHITAQESVWLVPDDCKVTKANFKYALAVLGLLGGGNILPSGYTRLEYLESSGAQYIDTGCLPNNETGMVVNYQPVVWENSFVAAVYDVDTNSRFYVPRWATKADRMFGWGVGVYFTSSSDDERAYDRWQCELNFKNSRIASVYDLDDGFYREASLAIYGTPKGSGTIPQFSASLPLFGRFDRGNVIEKSSIKLFSAQITQGESIIHDFIPALDPTGTPCMFDTVTRKAFTNDGTGLFIVGMTLAQVRGLHLPAGGGKLTLALPHEASIDRMAQAALERARANGWELKLQYAVAEVPAGYRKLEYLEGTGTQYIETGIKATGSLKIALEVEATAWDGYVNYIFGSEQKSGNIVFSMDYNDAYNRCGVYRYGAQFRYFTPGAHKLNKRYSYVFDENVVYRDGELLPFLNGVVMNKEEFVSPKDILLFGSVHDNESKPITSDKRVFSFSIFDNAEGVAQVDYVPCIAPDGTLGMYNKVDGTLHENAGTGAFIAGLATVDDVRELWLPETGGPLTLSVPGDTPDSAVAQLRKNNPTWQIAIQYRQ